MREATQPIGADFSGHILDCLPMLACHVEVDGRISYLNQSWRSFSGLGDRPGETFWTDLLDERREPPCHSSCQPGVVARCVLKDIILRHEGGASVRTDLHWQRLGAGSGGGWIVFCHPQSDPPLSRLTRKLASETVPDMAMISDQAREEGPVICRSQKVADLFEGAVSAPCIVEGAAYSVCVTGSMQTAKPDRLLTRSASYTARRAFHALGRELAVRSGAADHVDRLTGLPDRARFEAGFERALAAARVQGHKLGLMRADIDYLGDLNDLYGRDIGDQVLKLVADRLRLVTVTGDEIARTGDDEFSALVTGDVTVSALADYAQALLSFIDLPLRIDNRQIRFGLSIGAAIYPNDGDGFVRLSYAAQLALSEVKAHGRGGFRLFDPSMEKRGTGVTAQTNLVRQMLDQDRVYPAYQAKIRLADGHIIGAEALMRWHGRDEPSCGPEACPEIFRNYDLASRVAARMQERVFTDIAHWTRAGLMPPPISINVAPVEFMQDDYAEKLLSRLDRHELSARLIELELTEHVLYQNSEPFIHRALTRLRHAGVRVTLDDFGTGYSSLGFLRDFPVSSIKIDRSFISKVCDDSSMEVIVEAIIRFGEAVSVDVVAEGIETPAQLALLRRIGCPTGQGFLFSAPIEFSGFARLLVGSRSFPV